LTFEASSDNVKNLLPRLKVTMINRFMVQTDARVAELADAPDLGIGFGAFFCPALNCNSLQ